MHGVEICRCVMEQLFFFSQAKRGDGSARIQTDWGLYIILVQLSFEHQRISQSATTLTESYTWTVR